jgi:hypothetical protein
LCKHKSKSSILGSGLVHNALLAKIAFRKPEGPVAPPVVHVHSTLQLPEPKYKYKITPQPGDKLILVRRANRMKVCLGTLAQLEDITVAVASLYDLAIDDNNTIWAVGELGLIESILDKLPITEVILHDV